MREQVRFIYRASEWVRSRTRGASRGGFFPTWGDAIIPPMDIDLRRYACQSAQIVRTSGRGKTQARTHKSIMRVLLFTVTLVTTSDSVLYF